ncbi:hypothetical protein [Ruegeria hyattellae]|uniref:hypothetical protein n=1 Tax=Ruegeria hyattellae TaxID=3233337 RepID=UPI00355C2C52
MSTDTKFSMARTVQFDSQGSEGIFARLAKKFRYMRDCKKLEGMSDLALQDMGITRQDIARLKDETRRLPMN